MSTPAPCGSHNALRRHKRRGETCTTCETLFAAARQKRLVPCGTEAARRRHRTSGETCTTCDAKFKRPDLLPCGTPAAFRRHKRRGEDPCEPCTTAHRAADAARRRSEGVPARTTTEDLIQEIQFLLNAGEGEHRILTALGYQDRPNTLKSRLYRANRHDLITQIFNTWELAA